VLLAHLERFVVCDEGYQGWGLNGLLDGVQNMDRIDSNVDMRDPFTEHTALKLEIAPFHQPAQGRAPVLEDTDLNQWLNFGSNAPLREPARLNVAGRQP
jgi:hypothetical protein